MAQTQRNEATGGTEGAKARRSEELNAILQRIASHIAEVERRQAPAVASAPTPEIATPPKPVSAPPSTAGHDIPASNDIPPPAGPAPATISAAAPDTEADAAVDRPAAPLAPVPAPPAARATAAPDDQSATAPAVVDPAPSPAPAPVGAEPEPPRRSRPDQEPPALRSALAATLAHTNPTRARPVTGAPARDTESGEPWDPQSAEALTRIYETGEAGIMPLRSVYEYMSTTAQPSAPRAAAPQERPAAPRADDGHESLANLARRIETALDKLAPMTAVDGLAERFASLEARISGALDALAARADDTPDAALAGSIAELSRQVAHTEAQLARLDGIEERIGDVAARLAEGPATDATAPDRLQALEHRLDTLTGKLSDDNVVALFGHLVPTSEELTQYAEDAATRSAERALEAFAANQPAPAAEPAAAPATQELQSLTTLLADFMDERRRQDAGTIDALETLQLAMQHVLDRIEQIDRQPPAPSAAGFAATAAPVQAGHRDAAPVEAQHDLVGPFHAAEPPHPAERDEPRWSDRHAAEQPPAARPVDLDLEPGPPPLIPPRRMVAAAGRTADRGVSEDLSPANEQAHHEPPAAESPPGASDRRSMIEMARRAAERAKAEADSNAAAANAKAPVARRAAVTATADDTDAKGDARPRIRPGILVGVSAAALLLAGYWLVLAPRMAAQRAAAPAAIERAEPRVPAQAPDAEQPRAPAGEQPVEENGSRPDIEPADKSGAAPADPEAPKLASAEDSPRLENALVQGGPVAAGPNGIAIAGIEHTPSAQALIRARERVDLATLSQRTSERAAALHGAGRAPGSTWASAFADAAPPAASPSDSAPAQDTASSPPLPVPSARRQPPSAAAPRTPDAAVVTGSVAAASSAAAPDEARRLELPPAPIGPLSLRIAAAKGDPAAQLEIASRFAEGKGVRQSYTEAADWYQRAASQGLAVAQYRLATLHERGLGVTADRALARIWYERAAGQGNLKAMHNLAVMSAGGKDTAPDYASAARWFRQAAESGLADSQYNLAILAESGYGMPKDLTAALVWYTLAAKAGDADAARRRDRLISSLPQSAVQSANRTVADWRATPSSRIANDARLAADGWKRRGRTASN